MQFLADTNIIIVLEPTAPGEVEPGLETAAELHRLVSGSEHSILVHPLTGNELDNDGDPDRRALREKLIGKYPKIESPPEPSARVLKEVGASSGNLHDSNDIKLLAAVDGDAVDFLVTEDNGIHRKARRLGLESRVLTIEGAIGILKSYLDVWVPPEPHVQQIMAHELDSSDEIFSGLRTSYPEFDKWMSKCKREHRKTWVIKSPSTRYAAVVIVNKEDGKEVGLAGKVLKLCTFKVSKEFGGQKYGELLLRTIFNFAIKNDYDWLYVTFYDDKDDILYFVEQFGFEDIGIRNERNELIYSKPMKPGVDQEKDLTALEFHVRFGPHTLPLGSDMFFVPIRPPYFEQLFPGLRDQGSLFSMPFGNAIRKAYLCHAKTTLVKPGSILAFYRSSDEKALMVIGVAEKTLMSGDPAKIFRAVGKRTVFNFREIDRMTHDSRVLAILFRQAIVLNDPIPYRELASGKAIAGAPQTIIRVREEGQKWLRTEIDKRS